MPRINHDVVAIEPSLNLLDQFLDMQSFQEVSVGGQPAVIFKDSVGPAGQTILDFGEDGRVFAKAQKLTLTIPPGMTRVVSACDLSGWNEANGGTPSELLKTKETVRVQLLDRIEVTAREDAFSTYRPIVNHLCVDLNGQDLSFVPRAITWTARTRPCSKPLLLKNATSQYLCFKWDVQRYYADLSESSITEFLSREFSDLGSAIIVPMLIPNRTIVWCPVRDENKNEVHSMLQDHQIDSFVPLNNPVYLDGPDIFISSRALAGIFGETLT